MGGRQNYSPFLGTLNNRVPYYKNEPKRDPNCDNHPPLWSNVFRPSETPQYPLVKEHVLKNHEEPSVL